MNKCLCGACMVFKHGDFHTFHFCIMQPLCFSPTRHVSHIWYLLYSIMWQESYMNQLLKL